MTDTECVAFLQWALPRLHLAWPGFRKVRRQVCRRVEQRRRELRLSDLAAYRGYLEESRDEWTVLDHLCHITISRFCRDRAVFDALEQLVLPALAREALSRHEPALEIWSAGCASGEEPYTIAVMWELGLAPVFVPLGMRILATDIDDQVLRRAREACYPPSSLRELPEQWRELAFVPRNRLLCLRPELRGQVEFRYQDLRENLPPGPFHLILCRNLAFTYFELDLQREVAARLAAALRPGGALVVGLHEAVPEEVSTLTPWPEARGVYRKC